MVVEQTSAGDWAVWNTRRRYIDRFPTEAEAKAFAEANRTQPSKRADTKLSGLEAAVLECLANLGTVEWPGASKTVASLARKGLVSVERLPTGTFRIAAKSLAAPSVQERGAA